MKFRGTKPGIQKKVVLFCGEFKVCQYINAYIAVTLDTLRIVVHVKVKDSDI